ncbi:hypothetical protein T484DRAFT_1962958 [Baffinella frigidus]|nr:hypothetical protein T484DRAFT_1962958 [Cryptophyta sp. CCMP2293]
MAFERLRACPLLFCLLRSSSLFLRPVLHPPPSSLSTPPPADPQEPANRAPRQTPLSSPSTRLEPSHSPSTPRSLSPSLVPFLAFASPSR